MKRRGSWLFAALALGSVAVTLAVAGSAFAAGETLVVRDVDMSEFPRVGLHVDIPSGGSSSAVFTVSENGRDAEVLSAIAVDAGPTDVFLILDTSGSMEGASLDAAKAAATAFVAQLQPGSRASVISFSEVARLASPLADGGSGAVKAAIGGLEASGETALYDALKLTADETVRAAAKRPIALLLSDGGDTVSRIEIDDAVKALRGAGIPVLVVALPSAEADSEVLKTVATQTGGRFLGVTAVDTLTGVYEDLAKGLQTTMDVTYVSRRPSTKGIDVVVTAVDGGVTMTGATTFPNPLFAASSPRAVDPLTPVPPASLFTLAGTGVLIFVSVFALVLGLVLLFVRPRSALDKIKYYEQLRTEDTSSSDETVYTGKVTSSIVSAVDYIAGTRGINRFVYEQLDRAGWPLRPAEYTAAHLLIVIVVGAIATLVSGNLVVGVVAVVVAVLVPLAVIAQKVRSRQRAFEDQLPEVLNLIAGALRAGWGLQQSVDLVVEQMAAPMSAEFARAQTEIRLGRPVEQALDTVGRRMQSEDFSWVVTAISIQRDVGGNLAEVLDLVAETIRDRNALKRQISGLTAEGRLSATILLILPFAMVILLWVVNPGYVGALFRTGSGLIMLAFGIVLLVFGALWMRKIVKIEV